jgi:hypothetical protein
VQVDQRGSRAAMAHPVHQLAQCGPRRGREVVTGMGVDQDGRQNWRRKAAQVKG